MKKQIIRLTESDIHHIVENSVKRIIAENQENENFVSNVWQGAKMWYGNAKKKNALTKLKQEINNLSAEKMLTPNSTRQITNAIDTELNACSSPQGNTQQGNNPTLTQSFAQGNPMAMNQNAQQGNAQQGNAQQGNAQQGNNVQYLKQQIARLQRQASSTPNITPAQKGTYTKQIQYLNSLLQYEEQQNKKQ